MLQFVDAFNGNSAGCGHFVDLNAWMGVIVQYQFCGTFTDWAIISMASDGRIPISMPACMAA